MTVLRIELIDPRVKKLLSDLAEMNLIKIQELGDFKDSFIALLERLRSTEDTLTEEEILHEVEIIRANRAVANG